MRAYNLRSYCPKMFLVYGPGKLCSKFGEDWSISNATILSTDAGRTDGQWNVNVILHSVQCYALHSGGQTMTNYLSDGDIQGTMNLSGRKQRLHRTPGTCWQLLYAPVLTVTSLQDRRTPQTYHWHHTGAGTATTITTTTTTTFSTATPIIREGNA